jgi:D-alanyl-D-alanine carboxypeptidase
MKKIIVLVLISIIVLMIILITQINSDPKIKYETVKAVETVEPIITNQPETTPITIITPTPTVTIIVDINLGPIFEGYTNYWYLNTNEDLPDFREGVICVDEKDGDIEYNLYGVIDKDKAGTYYMEYSADDSDGNNTSQPFTVIIKDSDNLSDTIITTDITVNYNLILVNPTHKLPDDFIVDLSKTINSKYVDSRIVKDLESMITACTEAGYEPLIVSAYRSFDYQQTLYDNRVDKYVNQGLSLEDAKVEASKWVSIPGTSEYQSGLAVGIVDINNQVLNKLQEDNETQIWLTENCYNYGFILRYPEDKTIITNISYQPWSYRYVGIGVAKEIEKSGQCLEEYLDKVN